MAKPRIRLGDLLVEAGIVTREQLEEVLAMQKRDGRRLGTLLVESGLVTETQVTQILSQQLSVPWVSLHHIDFSRQLLDHVSQEIAEKYCLVPIFIRRVRGYGNTLYVAMDDPSDENAQAEVSQFSGLPVRTMIAPPADIRSAIRVYYGAGQEEPRLAEAVSLVAERAEPPAEAAAPQPERTPAEPPAAPVPEPEAAARAALTSEPEAFPQPEAPVQSAAEPPAADGVQPAASESAERPPSRPPDSSPQIETREITMPAAGGRKGRRMVTLTLLDGTQIRLPARSPGGANAAGVQQDLTAGDLVAALRAVASGADAREVLGQTPRWEAMFAALLALLLKKHLIADWEFVEEYKKS
jgi:type IV pilus assembly protein PilB